MQLQFGKRLVFASTFLVWIASQALLVTRAVAQTAEKAPAALGPDQYRAMLSTYCFGCHNNRAKTGGLTLDGLDPQAATDNAEIWEKALRKLRGHLMPPPGSPQPPQKDLEAFVTWMESTLDRHT